MGLIKKPAEITAKRTANILIYGQPGMGKTTLACSAEAPVLFDFDGGVGRIKAEHRVPTLQVTDWEEVGEALAELKAEGCYRTLVIDTIGKMLDCIVDYIKRTQPNMVQRDGSLSLKGYGIRKNLWKQFLADISQMGMSILFVGHEKEEKQGDMVVKRADAGNATTANDLYKDLDLIGYLSSVGNKRTLDFQGTDIIYAKAPTNMRKVYKIDVVVDAKGNCTGNNDYFQRVCIADYNSFLNGNESLIADYKKLIAEMEAEAENVQDAESAEQFSKYIAGVKHIYDSKIVARAMLNKRLTTTGVTYDKEAKKFVNPTKTEEND